MKNDQLKLFSSTDIPCTCPTINHATTREDYQFAIDKLRVIKEIITTTGWDISSIYYFYKETILPDCAAWDTKNEKYLLMRHSFQEQYEEIELNVKRT